MKVHNDFTLYFRVVPSGKRVVYFYAYDGSGKRLNGRSTGETSLTAARLKCNRLLKEGALIPKQDYVPTFAEYAVGWWNWDNCAYLKKRRKRYLLTEGYADLSKRNLEQSLLPYFGNIRMDRITGTDVENFLDYLIGDKKYKNATVNSRYATLKTMMKEAVDRNIIVKDPTEKIGKLITSQKEIQIISAEEFKKLFVGDWERVWKNDRIGYTANKLAALTGMRSAEVLGLKGCYVYNEHVYVCKQFDEYGYRDTKTKNKHNIPLPASLIGDLNELKKTSGDGFLFSTDGGGKPVSRMTILRSLQSALKNIGVAKAEIAERKLNLHGWRHFFNTEMLKGGMTIPQAQAITGHKSERMTEWYNHFDPTDFTKAKEVQDALLQPIAGQPQGQTDGTAERRFTVLPFPAKEIETQERKQA